MMEPPPYGKLTQTWGDRTGMSEDIEHIKRAFTAYRVEQEIGSGGMATVYLTRDEKPDPHH
jgi:hypothetical protein